MGTEVTGVSALLQTNSTGNVQNTGKDSAVQNDFSSFMNLNTYKQNTAYQVQEHYVQDSSSKSTADMTEYDKYQYQKSNVVKDAGEKSYSGEELETVNEKLNEFSENVKTILEEELSVTDEQVAGAMAVLQLSFADLLDTQNLTALVAELTGCEDSMQLLVTDGFQDVLIGVEEAAQQLLDELGMNQEQFITVCNEMLNTDVSVDEALLQNTAENEGLETDNTLEQTETDNGYVSEQTDNGYVSEQAEHASEQAEHASEQAETDNVPKQAEADVQTNADEKTAVRVEITDAGKTQKNTVNEAAEDAADEFTATEDASQVQTEENLSENTPGEETESSSELFEQSETIVQEQTENHGVVFEQNMQTVNNNPISDVQQPVQSYVDVNNIMEQISEYTRILVSGDTTSLEMQLNPENLGKIYIHVTEKAGTVTAQITATNESVKEALQAQVVTLKENLNQQGIKVEAVEVTIESHEFEQNLEQNARQEQENAEQTEKSRTAGGRRNINLNDLDSLSGVMSEEESLVAKMMQENGNQMDVTA